MYEEVTRVKIGTVDVPIRCDINVLCALQNKFETLARFEQKLIGMNPILNADGSFKYNSDGTLVYKMSEPSFDAIAFSFPLLAREGIEQLREQGEEFTDLEWKESFKDADFDYIQVALAINSEFQRCFHRKKKKMNSKATTKVSRKKSTSTE